MPIATESAGADGRSRLLPTLLACLTLIAIGSAAIFVIFATEPSAERDSAVRQSASLVDVVQGEFGTFRPSIEAMGTVRPAREITLGARVEGDIEKIGRNFVPGGFVEAGEMLLTIDDADYAVALRQRRAALEQALASLAIEMGEGLAAAADYEQFDRELPPARSALVLREPQRRAAEAAVESARVDVEQAELNLARTRIEAPFDAQVLGREVNLGSQVTPGTALGRLVGTATYWVEATVPVAMLQWVDLPDGDAPGSSVRIANRNAWAAGTYRSGRVYRLIGALEGATRLARLLVAVEDPLARHADDDKPRLMLGEFVQTRILGRELENVVRIDRDYIRSGETVWLMVDDRLEIRPVEIAVQDETYAYVRAGLSADDRVVTTRLATVQEGLRLRLDDSAGVRGGTRDGNDRP